METLKHVFLAFTILLLFEKNAEAGYSYDSPSQKQVIHPEEYCRSVNKAIGKCVTLNECRLFTSWLKERPLVKRHFKTVVKFTCFFDIKEPRVCCPLGEIIRKEEDSLLVEGDNLNLIMDKSGFIGGGEERQGINFPKDEGQDENCNTNGDPKPEHLRTHKSPPPPPPTLQELANKVLPSLKECGSPVKLSRYAGTFGAYPWIVQIGNYKNTNNGTDEEWNHLCSGTIVSSRYILTSSSCLDKMGNASSSMNGKLFIRTGEYDTLTNIDLGSPYLPPSTHADYEIDEDSGVLDNGRLVLLRTRKEINLTSSPYVKPVCLPFPWLLKVGSSMGSGGKLLVAGWGLLEGNNQSTYRTLQESSVGYTTRDDGCQGQGENYKSAGEGEGRRLCVGGNSREGMCISDVGGGLYLPLRVGDTSSSTGVVGKAFLVGVLENGPTTEECRVEMTARLRSNNMRFRTGSPIPRASTFFKIYSAELKWIVDKMKL